MNSVNHNSSLALNFQPAPSYREVMALGPLDQKLQSYSPEKAALLEQDYTGGEVPLQDIVSL